MKNHLLFSLLLALTSPVFAQTNVRAWYAQGQVWVVWKISQPRPETYGIYKKTTAFTSTTQASLMGRLFHYEYLPGTYWKQTGDTTFTYRIPAAGGGVYQLAQGEGLFTETVTNTGSAFYAVVAWGETAVTSGVNITQSAVPFNYNPTTQPVNCHLQRTETLPTGHKTYWFSMWALGRQDENAGRPDFPVLANAAKNGMPSMFIVSQALALDTTGGKKVPMTHLFHGGEGVAEHMIANRFPQFNLEPKQGISVAHNDDFAVNTITEAGDSVFTAGRSLWLGWTKRHDPFNYGFKAAAGDTVIPYTQRRVVWIHDWLLQHFPIDPARVAVMGYSMGSGGAAVLAKSFPEKFSTACLFNCGLRGGIDPTSQAMVGSIAMNLPTTLKGFSGETMRVNDVFDLNSRLSALRDFPLIRLWVGKNDENERMFWGADLLAQFRKADSLGWGTQINWDERPHTYPTVDFHWIDGLADHQQTRLDDLSLQESFSSNVSYPAFFNHRLHPNSNDPGTGKIGINNGDGDNWGTWGGYHRWENTQENMLGWRTTVWLESNAIFVNDNCPDNFLTADLAIRKPQVFKPATGATVYWRVRDFFTNQILQSGTETVQANDLIVIPQVKVFKNDLRKVWVEVSTQSVATNEAGTSFFEITVSPNPSTGASLLTVYSEKERTATVRLSGTSGVAFLMTKQIYPGENSIPLIDFGQIPAGHYLIEVEADGQHQVARWVKI